MRPPGRDSTEHGFAVRASEPLDCSDELPPFHALSIDDEVVKVVTRAFPFNPFSGTLALE
jgi:hypothetical protein